MGTGEFRRRYERKNYSSDVIFSVKGRAYVGSLKDININNTFMISLSVNQVAKGDVITISIPFTNGRKNIKRRAKVLWTNGDGFALEFF